MDRIFENFLTLHTAAFVIGCYVLTWLTRRGVETGKPSLKPIKLNRTEKYKTEFARWWNSFILYLIPPAWGLLAAAVLFHHLKWPPGFDTLQAVMFFGMVCGWLSGLLYKFLMKILLRKLGAKEEELDKEVEKAEDDPKVAGEDKKERKVEKESDTS